MIFSQIAKIAKHWIWQIIRYFDFQNVDENNDAIFHTTKQSKHAWILLWFISQSIILKKKKTVRRLSQTEWLWQIINSSFFDTNSSFRFRKSQNSFAFKRTISIFHCHERTKTTVSLAFKKTIYFIVIV